MKSFKEHINENESVEVNESLASIGAAIVKISVLTNFAFESANIVTSIYDVIKMNIYKSKEYAKAIKELDNLLSPYKNDLLVTDWGGRLFNLDGVITKESIKSYGYSLIYDKLINDIKNVISDEDFVKYKRIVNPILNMDEDKIKKDLKL